MRWRHRYRVWWRWGWGGWCHGGPWWCHGGPWWDEPVSKADIEDEIRVLRKEKDELERRIRELEEALKEKG